MSAAALSDLLRARRTALRAQPVELQQRRHASNANTRAGPKPIKREGVLKNAEIPFRTIQLVDPTSSSGSLLPPAALADILDTLDTQRYYILLVNEQARPPICRLVDKREQHERKVIKEKSAKKRAKASLEAGQGPPKELQLTWGIAGHDLAHKISRAREFLEKGHILVMTLAGKKGGERVSKEGKAELVNHIETELDDIATLQSNTTEPRFQTLKFKRKAIEVPREEL